MAVDEKKKLALQTQLKVLLNSGADETSPGVQALRAELAKVDPKGEFDGMDDAALGEELLTRILEHLGNPPRILAVVEEQRKRKSL